MLLRAARNRRISSEILAGRIGGDAQCHGNAGGAIGSIVHCAARVACRFCAQVHRASGPERETAPVVPFWSWGIWAAVRAAIGGASSGK
jgi:hypothetical protein